MAGSASGIRAGRAFIEIGGDDGPLRATLDGISTRFKAWGSTIAGIGQKMVALGLAASGALNSTVVLFGVMGDNLLHASQRTGIAVESLSALGYAADQVGIGFDDLENGIRKMQKTIVGAAEGGQEAQRAFGALGLTLDDLKGKSPEDQFKTIAARLAAVQDPTVKAAVAMQVFGRAGTGLIPLLDQGADGIDALVQRAEELGIVMSTQDAQAAEQFHQSMNELWAVLKAAGFTVGAALAPALRDLIVSFTNAFSRVKQFVDAHRELVTAVSFGVTAFTALGGGLVVAGFALQGLGATLGVVSTAVGVAGGAFGLLTKPLGLLLPLGGGAVGVLKAIGSATLFLLNPFKLIPAVLGIVPAAISAVTTGFGAVATVLGAVLSPTLLVGAAVVGLAGYLIYSSGVAGTAFAAVKGYATSAGIGIVSRFGALEADLFAVWSTVKDDAVQAFDGIRDAVEAGDWGLAGRIIMTAIQLEVQRGLQGLWDPLVADFDAAKGDILSAWTTLVLAMSKLFDETSASIQTMFNTIVGTIAESLVGLFADDATAQARADKIRAGAAKLKQDADAAAAAGDHDRAAQLRQDSKVQMANAAREDPKAARLAAIESVRDQTQGKQTQIDKGLEAKLDAIAKAAAENDKKPGQASDPARQAAIEALAKQQAELVKQAAQERARAPDAKSPKPTTPAPSQDGLDGLIQRTIQSSVTFNGSALFGLAGGGGAMQQTASNTKRSADTLDKINKSIGNQQPQKFS